MLCIPAESYCREVEKLNQMVMMDSCGVPASSCSNIGCSMPVAPVKDDEQVGPGKIKLSKDVS